MRKENELTVCLGKGGQKDLAESLARKTGGVLADRAGEGLTLTVDASGVTLSGYGLSYRGDFDEMVGRICGGKLAHELIARVAATSAEHPRAFDATAGMGEDSLLLAACGYEVTSFERDPVVAALLRDTVRRGKKHPALGEAVRRITVVEGDSKTAMRGLPAPDLIYLDPMFPARKKGLTNKRLQLIQHLESPCGADEGEELLDAAFAAHPKKIAVKRPADGPYLADRKPDYSLSAKAIRFDIYVLKKA